MSDDYDEQDGALSSANEELSELRSAALALYYAGHWKCDRQCNEIELWSKLRDALGLPIGASLARGGKPPTE